MKLMDIPNTLPHESSETEEEKLKHPELPRQKVVDRTNREQLLCLPYQGKQGEITVRSSARTLHKIIGDKVETKVVFI